MKYLNYYYTKNNSNNVGKKQKEREKCYWNLVLILEDLGALEIVSGQVIRLKDNKDHKCYYFILP